MNIGFVREIPRIAVSTQIAALEKASCLHIWNKERGDSLSECIGSLRPGECLAVFRLAVLSVPLAGKSAKKDSPRIHMRRHMKALAEREAFILEIDTGRTFKPDGDAVDAIFDAIDHWSGNSGRSSGRPKIHEYDESEKAIIRGLWLDRRRRNNSERIAAVRAYKDSPDQLPRWPSFTQAAWYEHFNE